MDDDEYESENSPLSQTFTQDGMTIEICIYRSKGDAGWVLEVVDEEQASTIWDKPFPTDRDALEEVMATIQKEGIATFLGNARKLH
jgi:hypothetical protein